MFPINFEFVFKCYMADCFTFLSSNFLKRTSLGRKIRFLIYLGLHEHARATTLPLS